MRRNMETRNIGEELSILMSLRPFKKATDGGIYSIQLNMLWLCEMLYIVIHYAISVRFGSSKGPSILRNQMVLNK